MRMRLLAICLAVCPASNSIAALDFANSEFIGLQYVAAREGFIRSYNGAGQITGTTVWRAGDLDIGAVGSIAVIGQDVWLAGSNEMIARVDPVSGLLTDEFVCDIDTPEGLATKDGNLIVAGNSNRILTYASDGTLVEELTLSRRVDARSLDFDGEFYYLGEWQTSHVLVVDLQGQIVGNIPTTRNVEGLAVTTDSLWASAISSPTGVYQYDLVGNPLNSFFDVMSGLATVPATPSMALFGLALVRGAVRRRRATDRCARYPCTHDDNTRTRSGASD